MMVDRLGGTVIFLVSVISRRHGCESTGAPLNISPNKLSPRRFRQENPVGRKEKVCGLCGFDKRAFPQIASLDWEDPSGVVHFFRTFGRAGGRASERTNGRVVRSPPPPPTGFLWVCRLCCIFFRFFLPSFLPSFAAPNNGSIDGVHLIFAQPSLEEKPPPATGE